MGYMGEKKNQLPIKRRIALGMLKRKKKNKKKK